ncbi:FtsX-like permease family protein [candidate division KSB1 bacterium]|nr:FtsX-like permease family protein [candidate division KSB1 bacterium]NIV68570.1 FtsX-like permease family protein [Phycisphaerae bacterium]NIR69126.1 FtsX-like permease family protein [candidate division KSB1 bacterium]NIS22657.1 FtsX-like permease family protein [candidate division KSB1 bacterium]NIT69515.1 FtsX-like permease family protein [candidate division KSB1 bacterium]
MEEALGKQLHRLDAQGQVGRTGVILGVVNNFHYQSLHETLKPLVIPFGAWDYAVRINPHNISETISYMQKTWETMVPGMPLNYRFLDDNIDQLYRKEQKLGQIIQYFTILAIFIACLGLFGLASFTTQTRTKEIGVRKVLGATVPSLVLLLSKEFTRLVLMAFVIATPIAWWAMNRWLENFAYRIGIEWWIFALAGALALTIALLTVSSQAIKAALTNPADSLRYE